MPYPHHQIMTSCVIGVTKVSICDYFFCEKGMFLDDGSTSDRNSKLKGSDPREEPTLA